MDESLLEIRNILKASIKPKEKIVSLSEIFLSNPVLIAHVTERFGQFRPPEQGTYLSALTVLSKDHPDLFADHLDFIIERIGDKPPRVKWEAAEIVGNLARLYPEQAAAAISPLLKNTAHEGTVVRWSAAFALTEIAKHHSKSRKQLLPFFQTAAESESGGVKSLYAKAIKALAKPPNQ